MLCYTVPKAPVIAPTIATLPPPTAGFAYQRTLTSDNGNVIAVVSVNASNLKEYYLFKHNGTTYVQYHKFSVNSLNGVGYDVRLSNDGTKFFFLDDSLASAPGKLYDLTGASPVLLRQFTTGTGKYTEGGSSYSPDLQVLALAVTNTTQRLDIFRFTGVAYNLVTTLTAPPIRNCQHVSDDKSKLAILDNSNNILIYDWNGSAYVLMRTILYADHREQAVQTMYDLWVSNDASRVMTSMYVSNFTFKDENNADVVEPKQVMIYGSLVWSGSSYAKHSFPRRRTDYVQSIAGTSATLYLFFMKHNVFKFERSSSGFQSIANFNSEHMIENKLSVIDGTKLFLLTELTDQNYGMYYCKTSAGVDVIGKLQYTPPTSQQYQ